MLRRILLASLMLLCVGLSKAPASDLSAGGNLIDVVERANLMNHTSFEVLLGEISYALPHANLAATAIDVDSVVHEEFVQLKKGLGGVRALLLLDGNGKLLVDSTQYPVAEAIDLSDRAYFKEAQKTRRLIIGEPVIGRRSGLSFLPIAQRFSFRTLVAVVDPRFLFKNEARCLNCISAVINQSGVVVGVDPNGYTFPEGFIPRIMRENSQDFVGVGELGDLRYALALRRSQKFSVTYITVAGLNTETFLDLN